MITLWTNESCIQCEQTKRFLDKNNIRYTEKSLINNPEAVEKFINLGFKAAPIVETSHDIWSGFKFERLKALTMEVNQ